MEMKVVPRRCVGIGQGFFTEAEVPKLTVRVRSGQDVRRGSYIGNERQPTAFVWADESGAVPDRELVLRVAKSGRYLWEEAKAVELTELFPADKQVARLDQRLVEWQRFFEKHYNPKTPNLFFWGRFHDEGKRLARQLQSLLIDRAVIRYFRPAEDPQSRHAPEIAL